MKKNRLLARMAARLLMLAMLFVPLATFAQDVVQAIDTAFSIPVIGPYLTKYATVVYGVCAIIYFGCMFARKWVAPTAVWKIGSVSLAVGAWVRMPLDGLRHEAEKLPIVKTIEGAISVPQKTTSAPLLLIALFLAVAPIATRAQSTDPSSATSTVTSSTVTSSTTSTSSPLAMPLGVVNGLGTLTLRWAVNLTGAGYDITTKTPVAQASLTFGPAVTSSALLDAGLALGGGATFANGSPVYTFSAGAISPGIDPLTFQLSSGTAAIHAGVGTQIEFGSRHDIIVVGSIGVKI